MATDDSTTREIPLTRGKVAIVDAADFEWLSAFSWSADKEWNGSGFVWYARRHVNRRGIRMHRAIMEAPGGVRVDHENGDGLDNRRQNLRFATQLQNARNRRHWSHPLKSSQFKGVSWSKLHGRWRAVIYAGAYNVGHRHARQISLGLFQDEEAAARAYDAAALRYFGEFAAPNLHG